MDKLQMIFNIHIEPICQNTFVNGILNFFHGKF
jgi:hypothetical protein